MGNYLKNSKRRAVIYNSTSTTEIDVAAVSQGSINGPLLFNISLNDLVLFLQYMILGNYGDDNNISITGSNQENLKKLLLSNMN